MLSLSSDNCRGRIELILGPVFAGKTTELQRRYAKYNQTNKNCVYIKHPNITHSKLTISSYVSSDRLEHVDIDVNMADIVCIDEGQLFKDLVEYCDKWADKGKIVIVAALSGNDKRNPFQEVAKIIPRSERIDTLTAICTRCRSAEASFITTYFDIPLPLDGEDNEMCVGGSEIYEAVCRGCRQHN
ncbi:thymidine kinase 1-like [Portunus trituberculatus]|uniref:thymidine kinase 1-like n=1 Tax=Portunus trituberculatus TaxID=210409 RepID=UPI001E1CFCB2|nr:thymidine kinase 1-like [Portunus trituberculatus]